MNKEKGRDNRDSRERAREKKDMVVCSLCWGREKRRKGERGRESIQRLGGREERAGRESRQRLRGR